jgi:molybdate transport system substrate-binding protein
MSGKAHREKVTPIASTGISVAVRKGAPKPDISSPDAFKRALLAAKSITYLDPKDGGASGVHFAKVLNRLGISDEMNAKTVFAHHTDAVGARVAKGEAEIGVIQFQLLFAVDGIEVIGPLPGDLQNLTVFAAAVMTSVKDDTASTALSSYLRSPVASASIRANGMEPAAATAPLESRVR